MCRNEVHAHCVYWYMCVWEVRDVQTCPKKNDKDSVSAMQIHKIIEVVTLEAFLSKSQAQYKQDSHHFR